MMKSVGKLFGLRRKCAPPKSRIDKKKTRVNPIDSILDDSDEGSYGSTTSVSSGSEYHNSEEQSGTSDSSYRARESDGDDSSESDEKRAVSRRQRKRAASAPAALDDSSSNSSESSSDVGGEPLRRVLQRKRLRLPEDSEDEALREKKREAEVKEAAAKRRERKNKLMELSKRRKSGTPRRRRRTMGSEEEEEEEREEIKEDKVEEQSKPNDPGDESSVEENGDLLNSSEEEKLADSSDSMKDFIVEEDEQKNQEGEEEGEAKDKAFLAHLPRQFITGSQRTHFQVVVKALLINVLDSTFLSSLYSGERTKRYAQEMKSSLLHFDERLVLPRLENLKQRSRWKERYKERVECYPKLRVMMTRTQTKGCEACELHRTGRFNVRLSGQLYHNNTLQEDQFMPDDSQTFFVGSVCASRTEVYHALKHFKYHLFERCRTALDAQKEKKEEETGEDDEPVKETVNKVFTKLQDGGWITEIFPETTENEGEKKDRIGKALASCGRGLNEKQYEKFEEHLNSADFFQEEKLD